MKVVFVYQFLTLGGVEAVLRTRLRSFASFGVDASAWFFRDGPGREMFEGLEENYKVGDLVDLRRYLEHQRPEVLVVVDAPEAFSLLDSLSFAPFLVVEVHSPYPENRLYLNYLDAAAVKAFVVPTSFQAETISKSLGDEAAVNVIPNPLDGQFVGRVERGDYRHSSSVVGWIGRLDNLKNWKALQQIAAELLRRRPGVRIWVVGRGGSAETEATFVSRASRLKVLHAIRWFRDIPYKAMPRWYDAVRNSGGVVLSTSKGESFGMTVAEAMARECAVVVPDQPPFDEYVDHNETGLCYRPGDFGSAVSQLERLIGDPDLRRDQGQKARVKILQQNSPERAVQKYANFLIEVAMDYGGIPSGTRVAS